MRYFAMVSTRHSRSYTKPAVQSFLENTELQQEDLLFLIDNDGTIKEESVGKSPNIRLVRNEEPLSFAANINKVLREALLHQADVYILHNDTLLTKGWTTPFELPHPVLLSALSNRQVQYKRNSFSCAYSMELEDCAGHEEDLAIIADVHRQQKSGYSPAASVPFFCARLPYRLFTAVGLLDGSLGKKGTEDLDYCLRAQLNGFQCAFALPSYVLHFAGRSTWNGAETKRQTDERLKTARGGFTEKWGETLCSLLLDNDVSVFEKHPAAMTAQQQGDVPGIIKALVEADGKSLPSAEPLLQQPEQVQEGGNV